MKSYFIKTPSLLKLFFKRWIWNFSKKEKNLFLTFDDGPTPEITEWTLKQLDKYNAKATFFCIGKNVEKHPNIYRKIIEHNHTIGNHTNNHLNGYKTQTSDYLNNFITAHKQQNLIFKNTEPNNLEKPNPKLFRPPYGRLSLKQSKKIREMGYKIIMWDVLSADFDISISKEKCLENVLKHTENGSIILFHDSDKAKERLKFVLPKVLEYYTEKGFLFKKIA